MIPTVKLYDEDSFRWTFSARLLSCTHSGSVFDIVLDATCFFPEEGGQTPDLGTLSSGGMTAEVTNVQIDENGIIHHYTDQPLPEGDVLGAISPDRRFYNMQQHTGEHLFSGLVHTYCGYDNVGFHLSDETVSMDYNGPLTETEIDDLEAEANRIIAMDVPVYAYYPEPSDLEGMDYRSKKELSGPIRIVDIGADGAFDRCACCAPHLNSTGKIGLLKVTGFMNYKGGTRLFILCGMRALFDYSKKQKTIEQLGRIFSAPAEQLCDCAKKALSERADAQAKARELSSQLLHFQIENALAKLSDETKSFTFFAGESDMLSVRTAINRLTPQCSGFVTILWNEGQTETSSEKETFRFMTGSSDRNCSDLAAVLRKKTGAKCGGKPEMIQGSVSFSNASEKKRFAEEIETFLL